MKKPGFKIVMLGAGNVAWHLAPALEKAGHEIIALYSRTRTSAATLANQLANPRVLEAPDFRSLPADLYLISVPDKALPQLLMEAKFPKGSLVAHTSGTTSIEVFKPNFHIKGAVFYPLQTFSKEVPVNFAEIPMCLEAPDQNAMELLKKVASSLSQKVMEVSSEKRKVLHVAAVFACNFTNHLFGISADILQKNDLQFEMLQPLIRQTIAKAFANPPFSVQTGPAIRHDENTLQAHREMLRNQPAYLGIYELLSRSIQQQAGKE
jgi:predicted short-subunit dehydrogenase-like oxidoreductase (DUF2520 family)